MFAVVQTVMSILYIIKMLLTVVDVCFAVVALLYATLIAVLLFGFRRASRQRDCNGAKTSVSIILPFRNEEGNIPRVLESLLSQSIDADFEIVAVDDHSTDGSCEAVANIQKTDRRLRLLYADGQGKKNALLTGIRSARNNIIVTVDADCHYPARWLDTMVSTFEQNDCDLLAGPVIVNPVNGWFRKFQFVDFASLVGSGIGAYGIGHPIMCNGANVMFSRDAVMNLDDPFNSAFSSGDDVFLLHKIKADNGKVCFTAQSDAMVETRPVESVGAFVRQRMRWGGKTTGYRDVDSWLVALVVAFMSMCFCASLIILPFSIIPFVVVYLSKLLIDTVFLTCVCGCFGNRKFLWWMPLFEVMVSLYTVVVTVMAVIRPQGASWKRA